MRLVLIALLVLTIAGTAGTAGAADLSKDQAHDAAQLSASRSLIYCTGIYYDNAFWESSIYVFGNALSLGATPGPLTTLDFVHDGYGTTAPYNYNLFVYDIATCTVVGEVPNLWAQDPAAGEAEEIVPLCQYNLVASGDVIVGIQPLTCNNATDCYPDLAFDYTSPPDGCGSRVTVGVPNTCVQILSTNGVVDFLLGVTFNECPAVTGACCVPGALCQIMTQAACTTAAGQYMGDGSICEANTCVTPTEIVTWGAVKALYR